MTVLALGSVKGSPGVTTAALALGATWPTEARVVVVECDPAGGDLAGWYGLPANPGLVSLAAAARLPGGIELVGQHCQRLPGGLEVVPGPASADQAAAALTILPGLMAAAADDPGWLLVADVGRLDAGAPTASLLAETMPLAVLCRPTAAELGHVATALPRLRALTSVGLVLVGEGVYGPAEIAAALRVDVLGTLPVDARAAAVLRGATARSKALRLTPLLRGARSLADQLQARLASMATRGAGRGGESIPGEYLAAGEVTARGGAR